LCPLGRKLVSWREGKVVASKEKKCSREERWFGKDEKMFYHKKTKFESNLRGAGSSVVVPKTNSAILGLRLVKLSQI